MNEAPDGHECGGEEDRRDARATGSSPADARPAESHEAERSASPAAHRSGLLDPLLDSSQAGLLGGLAAATGAGEADKDGPGADPWAHRRGEPRTFALIFCIYLLASAMLTIFATPVLGTINSLTFLSSARMLFVLVGVAIVVLWPMTRLSQAAPSRAVRAAFVDTVVVTLLTQAVLWPATILPGGATISPTPWLGLWPWSVTVGLSLLFASWSILVGGILACALTGNAGWRRTVWMMIVFVMTVGGMVVAAGLARSGSTPIAHWGLWSLLTAAPEFIAAPSGLTAAMSRSEWIAVITPALVSAPWWFVAHRRERARASQAA